MAKLVAVTEDAIVHHRREPKIVAVERLEIKQAPAHRRNFAATRGPNASIQFLVIHCTDGCEGVHKDDQVAQIFQRPDLAKRRSCHYIADSDSITQCVPDEARAWHCGRRGNALGLGLELCGRARQTREEWLDELSLPMLNIAARWAADKCDEYDLPVTFLTGKDLRLGATGITTHAEVGNAWRQTNHWDPGPHFPMDLFIEAIRKAVGTKSRK